MGNSKKIKIDKDKDKDKELNFIVIVENEPSQLAIENFNKIYRKIMYDKLSSSSSTQTRSRRG